VAKPALKALSLVRERSRAVVDSTPPAVASHEYRPLQGLGGKARRNSLATMFTGDPVLRMVQLVCQFPFFVEKLAHLVDSADVQRLADALVNVSVPFGRTLFLVKAMIESEFQQNKSQVASILRGNSATSKVMGSFSFFVGLPFLDGLVGEFVRKIVALGDGLTLEVDPAKEPSAEKRAKNRALLKEWTRQLVQAMSSEKSLAAVPPEICSVAKFTADNARLVCPENLNQLVGGYFMLRLVNPVLVAPEAYHLTTVAPSQHVRRNLTLISKLLQNISNGAVSSSKEAFMADFADFVKAQSEEFSGVLLAIAKAGVDTTSRPAIPVEEADVGFIEGKHLWFLHNLLQQKAEELSKALAALPRNALAEMELLNILHLVKRDQEPIVFKPIAGQASHWFGKHLRSGTITKKGDKKRKKHKRHFRLELTRHFLFFFEDGQSADDNERGSDRSQMMDSNRSNAVAAAAGEAAPRLVKCVPLAGLQCSLKQVKKETSLELVYFGRTHEFVNHETSENVAVWAQSIAAALEFEQSNPHAGNDRFVNIASKGAVSDVLTAFNSIPRLLYSVSVLPKGPVKPQPPAVSLAVKALDCSWEVQVTLERAAEIVEMLQAELPEMTVPPLPHVLTRSPAESSSSSSASNKANAAEKSDYTLHCDAQGVPLGGLVILRDWLTCFLAMAQFSPIASHSKAVLELLQINSPFRACSNASMQHLRWIHRYFVGGLATKNSRGSNVLMHLVVLEPSAIVPEHTEIIRFLVDSKAVNVKDADVEGNTALHKAILSRNVDFALTLAEMGVGLVPNKLHQYPLHLLASLGSGDCDKLADLLMEACPESVLAADNKGRTALYLAVSRKMGEVALRILDRVVVVAEKRPKPLPELAPVLNAALVNRMSEVAVRLIARGLADLSVMNPESQSPLHVSALIGNAEAVDLILEKAGGEAQTLCAARDKHQMTPLLCSGLGGNVQVLLKLLPLSDVNAQDSQQRTALLTAATSGSTECVKAVLDSGANASAVDASGRTALHLACRAGATELVQLLLGRGLSLTLADATGMTCLMAAAQGQSVGCCKLLLNEKGGAELVKMTDKNKHDALHYAMDSFPSGSDNIETVALLLGVGARGAGHVYQAVAKNSQALLALLLKNGADPNALDRSTGSTALHLAVTKASVPMITLLLQNGGWPNVKNAAGETPLSLAVSSKKRDVVHLLSEKLADK
jgi:ankyrin repeat protein